MDQRFIDAGIEAAAERLFDQHNGKPPPEGAKPMWANAPAHVQNRWRSTAAAPVVAALEAVDALHALSSDLVVVHADTRNYEFEGAGADDHEARMALRVALTRHQEQNRFVSWTSAELVEMVNEADVTTYTYGKAYRGGEEIQ